LDKSDLLEIYDKTKDLKIKEEIMISYTWLVKRIAYKLAFNRDELDDLIQIGMIGLLKSIEKYDVIRNIKFEIFATPKIIGEIKHYFRDKSRLLKIPRQLQQENSRVKKFIQEYTQNTGGSPTVRKIAHALNLEEEKVLEALEVGYNEQVVSLNSSPFMDQTLLDTLKEEDSADADRLLDKAFLEQAMESLSEREKKMIKWRFYEGLSQIEIAEKLNLSQTSVSRSLGDAIWTLKKKLRKMEADDEDESKKGD
jgi:RNA polymerase sigma-B factor